MTTDAVDALRRTVCDLHAELVRYGLVAWEGRNAAMPV